MGQPAVQQQQFDFTGGTGVEYGRDFHGNVIICLWSETEFLRSDSGSLFSSTTLASILRNMQKQAPRQFMQRSIEEIVELIRSEHPGFSVAVCLATKDGILQNTVLRNIYGLRR